MSKNKKAAIDAANVKAKTAPAEKKAVETKKEDVKPQVDNTPKEEKKEVAKETKTAPTTESKVMAKKDTQKAPDKPKKEAKIPTIIPEEATGDKSPEKKAVERATKLVGTVANAGIPIGSTSSSVEGKAMLAYVMQQRYANNDELKKNYPELYADINRSIDVVTLLALVDVRQDLFNRGERGELQLQINADQVLPLQSMADMLGIKLAPAKALPGGDGQLSINFSKSEVPAELAENKEPEVKVPELDPKKITTDEELKAALNYLISKDKNVAESIVNTVEWYRVYRGLKEENADKKLALDEKSVTDWINEIFSIIQPTAILRGLGRAVYLYTSQTGSPCMAHSIMHKHMCKAGWSEEQVAEALRALIGENFRYKLKDDPKADPKDDKALKAITGLLGNEYIDKLLSDFSVDTKGVEDSKKVELEAARENARKVIGSIRTNYFEKQGKNPTMDEIRMVIGQIINLYRDPADRLAEYCQDSIISPKEGEYPEKKAAEPEKKADEKKKLKASSWFTKALIKIGILEE